MCVLRGERNTQFSCDDEHSSWVRDQGCTSSVSSFQLEMNTIFEVWKNGICFGFPYWHLHIYWHGISKWKKSKSEIMRKLPKSTLLKVTFFVCFIIFVLPINCKYQGGEKFVIAFIQSIMQLFLLIKAIFLHGWKKRNKSKSFFFSFRNSWRIYIFALKKHLWWSQEPFKIYRYIHLSHCIHKVNDGARLTRNIHA